MRSQRVPIPAADRKRGASDVTMVGRAYDAIRELITAGHLAPSSRVVERELARKLAMSPTPVRAALHRLEQQGYLVTLQQGRSPRVVVAPVSLEDMRELYFLIGDLEGWAAHHAAALPKPDRAAVADRADAINGSLAELARSRPSDTAGHLDLDTQWHRVIVDAGAGPRLESLLATLKPQAARYDRIYAAALGQSLAVSIVGHEKVSRAIRRGDPDGARAVMMRNWSVGAERMAEVIEARGEIGSW